MIVLMRGTTCSGKDTFINDNFHEPCQILSSDDYREILTGDRSDQKANKQVFETIYTLLESRLKNRVQFTVVNATHLKMKDARTAVELSKKYRTPIMVLSIAPPEMVELKQRNTERAAYTGFNIPESVIERHYNTYFEAMEPFIKEAIHNNLFTFVELDQNGKVVRLVDGSEANE